MKLTPEVLPRVLADWHTHWHEGPWEGALDRLVFDFVRNLRTMGDHWAEIRRLVPRTDLQATA